MTDYDLRKQVKLVGGQGVEWTKERLEHLCNYIAKVLDQTPEAAFQQVLQADGHTYAYINPETGEWGGVGMFTHVQEGHTAVAHIYIWDKMFLGRRALHRALLKHFMEKHKLIRLGGVTPVDNRAALAFAKRIGFWKEGVISRCFCYNGGRYGDAVLHAIHVEDV